MKRIIVDFKKLTPEIVSLLVEKYPDGYDDDQVITFKNAKNETVEAVEVRTEDTVFLVKVSSHLETTMANFDEDDYDDADFTEPITEILDKKKLDVDELDAEDIYVDDLDDDTLDDDELLTKKTSSEEE